MSVVSCVACRMDESWLRAADTHFGALMKPILDLDHRETQRRNRKKRRDNDEL
jgi:hypothetical protein